MIRKMAGACRYGLMDPGTKGSGRITEQTAMEGWCTQKEISMKESGRMTRLMVKGPILKTKAVSIKEDGLMTSKMGLVLKNGGMVQGMKACMRTV